MPTSNAVMPMDEKSKMKEIRKQIGLRIKQVREMAGFKTQAELAEVLREDRDEWSSGRLGNYEAGISMPNPSDVELIAEKTKSSACWIMFGLGPIRALSRDKQAIRYQNLVFRLKALQKDTSAYAKFLAKAKLNKAKIEAFMDDPGKDITDRFARSFEKALGERRGWMDEQHADHDPLFNSFPDDLRELINIYSELDGRSRAMLLALSKTIKTVCESNN